MMMIGETRRHHHHHHHHHHQAPPWSDLSPSSPPLSPTTLMASLHGYFLSGPEPDPILSPDQNYSSGDQLDTFFPSGDDDDFFMYEFKVRKCTRARAHDWTECPFAHPGEKARRRDPRKYNYSGTACSEFRKGGCKKGDCCEFAHGVFECWLHPSRYRTQACKDGPNCRRRVCFFAHHPDQLRAGSGPEYPDDGALSVGSGSGSGSVGELVASLRNLQLSKVKSMPSSWTGGGCGTLQIGSPVFGSPRGGSPAMTRPGFFSLPTTPTRPGIGYLDLWEGKKDSEEEPVMERVESGRVLRARMFEKLSKENPLNGPGPDVDVGWVSDLIK